MEPSTAANGSGDPTPYSSNAVTATNSNDGPSPLTSPMEKDLAPLKRDPSPLEKGVDLPAFHTSADMAPQNLPFDPYGNNGGGKDLDQMHENMARRMGRRSMDSALTAGSINIPPEIFEKLYLSPENRVKGELRKTFGNPTPIALIGFLISVTPLACDLMGWRGAGGNGAASTGVYFAFGGLLMMLGSLGEWIIGNTFPFVVFGTFGAFWIAFAMTLIPWFNAYGAYVTDPTEVAPMMGNPGNPLGLKDPSYNASFAFLLVWCGLICVIFLICSLRTNIIFVLMFFCLINAFSCLAASYFNLALAYENAENTAALKRAGRLSVAAGAFAFVNAIAGWWIFFAIMLASVDFPFTIPVGDLSHLIKGASERDDKEKGL